MKIIINTIACLFLVLQTGYAQDKMISEVKDQKHEISVSVSMGLSTLKFDTEIGKHKNKMAPGFGIGYRYHFNNNFSLGTGVELSFYNSDIEVLSFASEYATIDDEATNFDFRYKLDGLKEDQKSTYLNIPITFQYQTPIIKEHKFFAVLGGKIGLPISSKYKTNIDLLKTTGYYSFSEGVEIENIPSVGFGTFKNIDTDNDLNFKLAFIITTELGVKWKLSSSYSIYTGFYLDYGLNNIMKEKDVAHIVGYNPANTSEFIYGSVTNISENRNVTDKITPMAVGFKLRFSLYP